MGRLAGVLHSCPAQGVPFTARFERNQQLFSWGIDPPAEPNGHSWRSWITSRIASNLVQARVSTTGNEAMSFALFRPAHLWRRPFNLAANV